MKNRRISSPWILMGTLILILSLSACREKSATPDLTPAPTLSVVDAQNAMDNDPTRGGTDGATDGTTDGATDGTVVDGATDGATDGTVVDGTTDGATDGTAVDGATDGATDGTAVDGTTDGATDGTVVDGTTTDGGATTPAEATATPAPTDHTGDPSNPSQTTHLVQPGDTVYNISVRYRASVDAIAKANQLGPYYTIYVGQTLVIPSGDGSIEQPIEPPPPTGCSATHVVQSGENLFRIGLRYGKTVDQLAAANPEIVNPNNIKVGQVICIP